MWTHRELAWSLLGMTDATGARFRASMNQDFLFKQNKPETTFISLTKYEDPPNFKENTVYDLWWLIEILKENVRGNSKLDESFLTSNRYVQVRKEIDVPIASTVRSVRREDGMHDDVIYQVKGLWRVLTWPRDSNGTEPGKSKIMAYNILQKHKSDRYVIEKAQFEFTANLSDIYNKLVLSEDMKNTLNNMAPDAMASIDEIPEQTATTVEGAEQQDIDANDYGALETNMKAEKEGILRIKLENLPEGGIAVKFETQLLQLYKAQVESRTKNFKDWLDEIGLHSVGIHFGQTSSLSMITEYKVSFDPNTINIFGQKQIDELIGNLREQKWKVTKSSEPEYESTFRSGRGSETEKELTDEQKYKEIERLLRRLDAINAELRRLDYSKMLDKKMEDHRLRRYVIENPGSHVLTQTELNEQERLERVEALNEREKREQQKAAAEIVHRTTPVRSALTSLP